MYVLFAKLFHIEIHLQQEDLASRANETKDNRKSDVNNLDPFTIAGTARFAQLMRQKLVKIGWPEKMVICKQCSKYNFNCKYCTGSA
jgi:hypothetical protein